MQTKDLKDIKTFAFDSFKSLSLVTQSDLENHMQNLLENIDKDASMDILRALMEGINEALVGESQKELLKLIDMQDKISQDIQNKKELIRNKLELSFRAAEKVVSNSNIELKEQALKALNDAVLKETRLIDILKESVQTALLTTIEKGEDVDQTTEQIISTMLYSLLSTGEFSKKRIIHACKSLMEVAIEVAQASQIYSDKIISGAILGIKDGTTRLVKRIKQNIKYVPNELKLGNQIEQLQNIDDELILMLRKLRANTSGIVGEQIDIVLNEQIDTYFEKLKRLSELASEQLSERIEELRNNDKVEKLRNATEEIRQNGIKTVSSRLYKAAKDLIKK